MTKIFKFTKIGTDHMGVLLATDSGAIRQIEYQYGAVTVILENGQQKEYRHRMAAAILAWANACSYDVFAAYERNGATTTGCEEIAAPVKETA